MPYKGAKTKPNHGSHKRTARGTYQNGAGVSHRDAVPQNRKFIIYDQLPIDNATSDFAFGYRAMNIRGNAQPFQNIINFYSQFYEQYRVRSITTRAQCGFGYTNDDRIKSYCVARVDVDNQATAGTVNTVQGLLASENTTHRTFTERGNVELSNFPPICRSSISNLSEPFLPNRNQWYSTNDVIYHTWKGNCIAVVIPEPSILPNAKKITVTFELDLEFRGRITSPTAFTASQSIYQSESKPVSMAVLQDPASEEWAIVETCDITKCEIPEEELSTK